MSDKRSRVDAAVRTAALVDDGDLPSLPPATALSLARETMATLYAPANPEYDGPESDGSARVRPLPPAAFRRAHRRRLIAAGSLVAAATLGVTLTQTLGGAAPAAFADWQAVPQVLTGAAAQHQIDQCDLKHGLYPMPAGARTLVEQRGRVDYIVYDGDGEFGTCMLLDERGDGGMMSSGARQPAADDIVFEGGTGAGFTFDASGTRVDIVSVAGRAGSQVSSVRILRADGVVVTAAVHDGLWAAWWPGTSVALRYTVYTRDGHSHDSTRTLLP